MRYRLSGRTRKHTIGAYPAIDLKAARELAAKALRAVAEGRDPGREKAQARGVQPDTVEAVARCSSSGTACAPTGRAPRRRRSSCSSCTFCRAGAVG